ncbi:MAG: hypothetical protein J0L57_09750 [Burkholderiales bacterium]|nr:hypothetical protein [Burkholderiales bacterium]
MSFTIALTEAELREMPIGLRDQLLKWYFDRAPTDAAKQAASPSGRIAPVPVIRRREETGRVSFQEFVRAGLLQPGSELICRTLKRQQRGGGGKFLEAGKVLSDGSVGYRGHRYDVPSKLAIEVVNSNGGKTEALNGYDYLFVRSSKGDVPLSSLRDQFLGRPA